MASPPIPCEQTARRWTPPLLLLYPILALAGAWTHWQVFPLAALQLLATVLLLPRLLARQVAAWAGWLLLLGLLLLLARYDLAGLLLEAVPVLINAGLAIVFGRTLRRGCQPLVARFITLIEGPARLAQPGVARYARQVTWAWTLMLSGQALVLAVLLLCAERHGLLARFGIVSPLPVPDRWAALWLHVGGYALLGAAFLVEYGYRRWHLRHLQHPRLFAMLLQLARHWPQLVRGGEATVS